MESQQEEEIFETPDLPEKSMSRDEECVASFSHSDQIDQQDNNIERSFQMFMGKVYDTTSQKSIFSTQEHYELAPEQTIHLTPLQRYTRIQSDLQQLESELDLLAQDQTQEQIQIDAIEQIQYSEMQSGVQVLQAQLKQLTTKTEFQTFLAPSLQEETPSKNDQAPQLASELLEKVAKCTISSSPESCMSYEVYYDPSQSPPVDQLARLDHRVSELEKLMGCESVAGKDLITSMQSLESRIGLLNEKKLDAVATRVAGLIHQLQVLKRTRTTSKPKESPEEVAKLTKLYQVLEELEPNSWSLHLLLERLQILEKVHQESVEFGSRLTQLEASQDHVTQMLETDERLLTQMEQSLKENVEMFERNCDVLAQKKGA